MSHVETVTIKAPPRRKLTEGEVRERHYKLAQQRTTVERLARELEADAAALRQQARDDGHAALLQTLEAPKPTPAREPGPLKKCRLRVSLSTEYEQRAYYGPPKAVVLWPAALVDALIKHGNAEAVDQAEPLHVPAMPYVP